MNPVTLCKLSYGMYVVASVKDGKLNGQVANTVFQVTSEPPTIAVSIHKDNLTREYIESSKVLSVSILTEEAPMTFIGLFGFKSGRKVDKFKETKYKIGVTGAPVVLDYTLGYLEVKVINQIDAGTHTIFIGEVVESETISEAKAMTYDCYHDIKKGKAPKTAPTYRKE